MIPLVVTSLLLLGMPLVLVIYFRSNAAIMFLSSCAGIVLLNSLDPTVVAAAGSVVPKEGEAYVRLFVVLLAIVFSALMTRHAHKKAPLLMLHILLTICMALMLWVTLPLLIRISWMSDSTDLEPWQILQDFQTIIIAVGFALSLVTLFKRGHGKDKEKH